MEKRIRKIIEKEKLTASRFADTIGVQRSSISHILSGRNKPSLELINKILDHFPDLNTDWLLLGKGAMLKSNQDQNVKANYAFEKEQKESDPGQSPPRTPVRIVIFYSDHSFEEYRN